MAERPGFRALPGVPGPLIILCTAACLVLGLGDLLAWGGEIGRHLWIDTGWTAAGGLATVTCARTGRRGKGRDRTVWWLMAMGCGAWTGGQLAWNYYDFSGTFPPSPSPADAGYLLLAPFGVAAFVRMMGAGVSARLLLALDVAVLACAFGILFTHVYWTDIQRSALPPAGIVTDLLYPVLFAALACTLVVAPIGRAWHNRSLLCLLLGLLAQAVAFVAWTPSTLAGTYAEGDLLDVVWMGGLILMAAGALTFDGFPAPETEAQIFGPLAYLPLIFSVAAVLVRVADVALTGMNPQAQHALNGLIAGMVIANAARLAITLRGSRRLFLRAEQAVHDLRESEHRFRAIFTHAPIGIEIADLEGRLIATNQALQQMLGYGAEELHGVDYTAISHPDDIEAEAHLDEELLDGRRDSYQLVKRHIRKDGSAIWTRLTASELRDAEGNAQFAIGMVEDITERRRAEEALQYQALHDALTGLPNRMLLHDRLKQVLRTAAREEQSCALLLMDLNGFKEINDTFGHHYGDALLQEIAARLTSVVRASDTVARLGGDEFAVVLPGASEIDAMEVAGDIAASFAAPVRVHGQCLHVDGSIGIAAFPAHGNDAVTLLRQADIGMYAAKRHGLPYAVYDAGQDRQAQRRILLVGALREAIEGGGLDLHYQPKAVCADGCIVGVEALVRWQHPQFGVVSPDEFIPLAENAGLIGPLTRWVLAAALRQTGSWRAAGIPLQVWVNLSARTLHDRDFPDMVDELLARSGVDPTWLGLEVTESAVMSDPDRALHTLQRLHETGIALAIDDFGTGYSSLNYLQRLPVSELKIDRAFVKNVLSDRADRSIVQATVSLAHELDLRVTAEGVETEEAWEALAGMGMDFVQGYYLCRPLPAAELTEWLARHGRTQSRALRVIAG